MKMDLLSFDIENILTRFHPCLRTNFEELFVQGKIGLSPFTLNDISLTKHFTEDDSSYSYHHTLKIPFAGKLLSWEVIFNPDNITFAPDFNFNDDNFFMSHDIDLIVEHIPSLVNWDAKNPKALMLVLQEFLCLFKKQQVEKLHKDNIYSKLNNEYEVLLKEEIVSADDVEVLVENSVHFLININVDISTLPEYSQIKGNATDVLLNASDDRAILRISFIKLDGSKVNTFLQLSPRVDQVLGSSKSLHIPTYNKQTTLVEYVVNISKLLQSRIKAVEQHYKLKKEYIASISTLYCNSIIEYDSETFSKAVFLCEVDDYRCVVHVNIGSNFPHEKPSVIIYSLYCISYTKPCSEEIDQYPYSPRWTPGVMLNRLNEYLKEEAIPKFKNHKH